MNFVVLALSVCTGCLTAAFSHTLEFRIGAVAGWSATTFLADFWTIASWNLRVMGTIVLSVCTLGVFSLVELVWLGFSFGMDAFSIWQHGHGVLSYFLTYAPIEVSAFAISASAAQSFSLSTLRFFFLKERLCVRPALLSLGAAVFLLLAAALMEAHAHQIIKGGMLQTGEW
ncbi:MAG: stage II sporulation protein M [Candidatus Acidiferrum sp.]